MTSSVYKQDYFTSPEFQALRKAINDREIGITVAIVVEGIKTYRLVSSIKHNIAAIGLALQAMRKAYAANVGYPVGMIY